MSNEGREREMHDAPVEEGGAPRDDRRDSAPPRDGPAPAQFKCFIGGISWHLDDKKLREAFADFNPTEAVVMMDRMTGRSRGFGFVMFGNKADQDAAIDRMHNTELDGRRISVTRAVPQSETAPGTPADALRRGAVMPRDAGRYSRGGGGGGGYGGGYGRADRGGYGRDDYYRGGGGGGYGGGYGARDDYYGRGGYGGGYGGGYAAGGYGGGYGRDDYYRGGGGYGGGGYDQRGGYGGYDQRGASGGYDYYGGAAGGGSRGGYGADRGGYGGGGERGYERDRPY